MVIVIELPSVKLFGGPSRGTMVSSYVVPRCCGIVRPKKGLERLIVARILVTGRRVVHCSTEELNTFESKGLTSVAAATDGESAQILRGALERLECHQNGMSPGYCLDM
jgi:hypothetical protein